jgi:hypothetical protein
MESWRGAVPVGEEKEALDIVFTSCPECLNYPHVYNPKTTIIPRYLDAQDYLEVINKLGNFFKCTPTIFEEWKFSITSFKFKYLARIRADSEFFHVWTITRINNLWVPFPKTLDEGLPSYENSVKGEETKSGNLEVPME